MVRATNQQSTNKVASQWKWLPRTLIWSTMRTDHSSEHCCSTSLQDRSKCSFFDEYYVSLKHKTTVSTKNIDNVCIGQNEIINRRLWSSSTTRAWISWFAKLLCQVPLQPLFVVFWILIYYSLSWPLNCTNSHYFAYAHHQNQYGMSSWIMHSHKSDRVGLCYYFTFFLNDICILLSAFTVSF